MCLKPAVNILFDYCYQNASNMLKLSLFYFLYATRLFSDMGTFMNSQLLAILVCPHTKNPLQAASTELLAQVNERIQKGNCLNVGKEKISLPYDQGLFEPKTQIFYPFMEGIPVLVYEKGIKIT